MISEILPIGSVVLLHDSSRKVMIAGVCQRGARDPEKIWDYVGLLFPEGYLAPDKLFLFDREQIQQIYALGYQDQEQMAFSKKAQAALLEIKKTES